MVLERVDVNVLISKPMTAVSTRFVLQIRQRLAFGTRFLGRFPVVRLVVLVGPARLALLAVLGTAILDKRIRRLPPSATLRAAIIAVYLAIAGAIGSRRLRFRTRAIGFGGALLFFILLTQRDGLEWLSELVALSARLPDEVELISMKLDERVWRLPLDVAALAVKKAMHLASRLAHL